MPRPIVLAISGAFLALVPAILAHAVTKPSGIGLNPDSIEYLSASAALASRGVLENHVGEAYVSWPPLFPALLALARMLGLDVVATMPQVQGLFIGATGVITFAFLSRVSGSWLLSFCVATMLVISPHLLAISTFLLAEPIYTFLMTAATFSTVHYLERPALGRLLAVAGLCALAFLQRYAALPLVMAVALCVATLGTSELRQRLRHAAVLGAVTCAPVAFWALRNLGVADTLSGERHFFIEKGIDTIPGIANEFGFWFLPLEGGWPLFDAFGIVLLSGAALAVVRGFSGRAGGVVTVLGVLGLVILSYTAFIAYALSTACCMPRFMAPLYPVALAFIVLSAVSLYRMPGAGPRLRRWIRIAGGAAIVIGISVNGWRVNGYAQHFAGQQIEHNYNSQRWETSDLIRFLEGYSSDGDICYFSNAPDALWLHLDAKCVSYGPRKGVFYLEEVRLNDRADVVARMRHLDKRVLFVWFSGWRTTEMFTVEAFEDDIGLRQVYSSADGAIYEVSGAEQ